MRFASLEHFDLSLWRIVILGGIISGSSSLGAGVLLADVLGGARVPILFVIGVLVFYIVLSTPRRILDGQRVSQARESVLLSAAGTACLRVTGSGPRTLILLRSRDAAISKTLLRLGRRVLLGTRVADAIAASARTLSSYSAVAALNGLATRSSGTLDPGDEESRGLAYSSELSKETKVPIFMTACFFTPMMLLLYSVFSHSYGAGSLAELIALEFLILDFAFYLTSTERGPR